MLFPKDEEQPKLQAAVRRVERSKRDDVLFSPRSWGFQEHPSPCPGPGYSWAAAPRCSHHNMSWSTQTKGTEGLQLPYPQSQTHAWYRGARIWISVGIIRWHVTHGVRFGVAASLSHKEGCRWPDSTGLFLPKSVTSAAF